MKAIERSTAGYGQAGAVNHCAALEDAFQADGVSWLRELNRPLD